MDDYRFREDGNNEQDNTRFVVWLVFLCSVEAVALVVMVAMLAAKM